MASADNVIIRSPIIHYGKLSIVLAILYLVSVGIHRLYFSCLAKFPGPRLWAMTRLPYAFHNVKGTLPFRICQIHDKYGPIVRLAPTEISFITGSAYNDIYGGKPSLPKSSYDWAPSPSGVVGLGIYPSTDADHTRMRKSFASGFSDKSVREHEVTIQKYISLLVTRLHENCANPVDIMKWFNCTTFDITGDLTFGEPYECLSTSMLHPWVKMVFNTVKGASVLGTTQAFWPLTPILMSLVPKSLAKAHKEHIKTTTDRLQKRLSHREFRNDFVQPALRSLDEPNGVSYLELLETCVTFMVGGSETTATVMTASIYYLLQSPSALTKLTAEIRSTFKSHDDITLAAVNKLEYANAVINEALRLHPPVPAALRRLTFPSGNVISGQAIPGKTIVAIDNYAAGRSTINFTRSNKMIPERWFPSGSRPIEFDNDNRKAVKPFSVGPRNCIGKGFAYMEMKLMLAHVTFAFDIEGIEGTGIVDGKKYVATKDWMKNLKVTGFWHKDPLMVKLTPVAH